MQRRLIQDDAVPFAALIKKLPFMCASCKTDHDLASFKKVTLQHYLGVLQVMVSQSIRLFTNDVSHLGHICMMAYFTQVCRADEALGRLGNTRVTFREHHHLCSKLPD